MFETTIAGSLPKPSWLAEPEKLWAAWKLEGAELEQGEFIAASFAKGRLDVLDGVNHIPHVEDPGRVFALIEPFLRQQPPELGPLRLGE